MLRALLVIMLLALSTCTERAPFLKDNAGQPRIVTHLPITWSFECTFPETYKDDVRAGLQYWNIVTGRFVFAEAKDCGIGALTDETKARLVILSIPRHHTSGPLILATTESSVMDYVPNAAVMRYYLPWLSHNTAFGRSTVVRHEAGHMLGLDHTDRTECLMFPKIYMDSWALHEKDACPAELDEVKLHYKERQ